MASPAGGARGRGGFPEDLGDLGELEELGAPLEEDDDDSVGLVTPRSAEEGGGPGGPRSAAPRAGGEAGVVPRLGLGAAAFAAGADPPASSSARGPSRLSSARLSTDRPVFGEAEDAAALAVQRAYRGHRARREVSALREDRALAEEKERFHKARKARLYRLQLRTADIEELLQLPSQQLEAWKERRVERAATTVQAHWRRKAAARAVEKLREDLPHRREQEAAAKVIQKAFREHQKVLDDEDYGILEDAVDYSKSEVFSEAAEARLLAKVRQRIAADSANPEFLSDLDMGVASEAAEKYKAFQRGRAGARKEAAKREVWRRQASLAYAQLAQEQMTLVNGARAVKDKGVHLYGPRRARAQEAHAACLAEARKAEQSWWLSVGKSDGEVGAGWADVDKQEEARLARLRDLELTVDKDRDKVLGVLGQFLGYDRAGTSRAAGAY